MKQLINIQNKLKAPKSQHNSFGNYDYRNLEDICEALKPILLEEECYVTISDDIVQIGDRYYVKATVTLVNKDGNSISNTAYARESLVKKGMDDSQITGATSSYARKYAMNGLFLIDDTRDADSMDNSKKTQISTKTHSEASRPTTAPSNGIPEPMTKEQEKYVKTLIMQKFGIMNKEQLPKLEKVLGYKIDDMDKIKTSAMIKKLKEDADWINQINQQLEGPLD